MQFERHATESDILARIKVLRAQGFSFDASNEQTDSGFSPCIIAYCGRDTIRVCFYRMQSPWHAKRTEAFNHAESIIDASKPATLSRDSAIAYVQSTFAGSFDSILDCELIEDCGMTIAIVRVANCDVISRADIWLESGKLYGEL